MAFGLSAGAIAGIAMAGGAVAGAAISANASKNAANTQAEAAKSANGTQLYMYNQTRDDQAPWRARGDAAGARLNYLLGLPGSGGMTSGAMSAKDLVDTSNGDWQPNQQLYGSNAAYKQAWDNAIAQHYAKYGVNPNNALGSDAAAFQNALAGTVDFNAINAAQTQQNQADPAYGSLLHKFGAADFQADAGYQFRLSEGMRGVNNSAAARGGVLSGAALKAATKYNQDFASNEYGNVYNRYNQDQTNQFNRLASIAGIGQTATNQVAASGQNMANNVSQNQLSAGNARASGYVGTANAFNNALGQGINAYQTDQLMNKLGSNGNGFSGYGSNSNTWDWNALKQGPQPQS